MSGVISHIGPNISTLERRQDSLIDHFIPDRSELTQTHFVEWFDGDALDSIWTFFQGSGGATKGMADAVGDGFQISSNAGDPSRGLIYFNDKRHYDLRNSILIVIYRQAEASPTNALIGAGLTTTTSLQQFAAYTGAAIGMFTADATNFRSQISGGTFTDTGVALDTVFHRWKIENSSGDTKFSENGVLKVTNTSPTPSGAVQPGFEVGSRTSAGTRQGFIRYLEVFNK